jgi:hypothetical protein
MKSLFTLPLPIFVGALAMQGNGPSIEGPGWLMAALTGVFVVLWLLNAVGRLPGGGPKNGPTTFGTGQREQLAELHWIVTREDRDKPGWPMVWSSARETREIRELLKGLSELKEVWQEERAEWKREKVRMEHRITVLEDRQMAIRSEKTEAGT